MSALAPHTKANREFFAAGFAPHRDTWADWIQRGVVKGKVIDGKPYVDLDWFAANDYMTPMLAADKPRSGLELLS